MMSRPQLTNQETGNHIALMCAATMAGDRAGPSAVIEATAAEPDPRWLDGAVQQCLKLCSNVDLVYKLLIQDIHPVLGKSTLLLLFVLMPSVLL